MNSVYPGFSSSDCIQITNMKFSYIYFIHLNHCTVFSYIIKFALSIVILFLSSFRNICILYCPVCSNEKVPLCRIRIPYPTQDLYVSLYVLFWDICPLFCHVISVLWHEHPLVSFLRQRKSPYLHISCFQILLYEVNLS